MAGHQHQVRQTINVVCAVSVFGNAQRVVNPRVPSRGVPTSGGADVFGGHAGDRLGCFGGVRFDFVDDGLEVFGMSIDERLIVQAFVNDYVSHRGQQPNIGSRFELQMQISHLGQPIFSRIRDNQLRTALPCSLHFHRDDRMGFGCIGTCNEQHFRIANLINRVGHCTRAKHCHQTGNSGGMSGSGTLMNVVRAERRS